jgi:hypothetical protein
MVASGHKPKRAIAAALANARSSKKMAKGGMVDDESDQMLKDDTIGSVDSMSDEGRAGEPIYPEGNDDRGLSSNVETQETLAKALQQAGFKSNNNSHSFESDDSVAGSMMSKGGIVQPEHGDSLGNKPELDWVDDGGSEPMSVQAASKGAGGPMEHSHTAASGPGLSDTAKAAIAAKKKKRVYGSYDPR